MTIPNGVTPLRLNFVDGRISAYNAKPIVIAISLKECLETIEGAKEELTDAIDTNELLANVFKAIEKEQSAELKLAEYCNTLIQSEASGNHYREMELVLQMILKIGEILVRTIKTHGLYENGSMRYLVESVAFGKALLREKESYFAKLKNENRPLH